ncbi:hypothetical protein evm_010959 [Chilo suppressalis]|nr:hypothetical protein evm_010959 [Chilo suppressalis]
MEGKTELEVVTGPRLPPLDGNRYICQCLENNVMPYAGFIGQDFVLMHDNARAHTVGIVRDKVLAPRSIRTISQCTNNLTRRILLINISPRINGSFEEACIIPRQKLINLYWL